MQGIRPWFEDQAFWRLIEDKEYRIIRLLKNIYVKPIDFGLYDWARGQRQSLSEVIALALQEYRKKRDK
jgi:hypothetical protein